MSSWTLLFESSFKVTTNEDLGASWLESLLWLLLIDLLPIINMGVNSSITLKFQTNSQISNKTQKSLKPTN